MQIMALVTEKLERISPAGELSPGLATRVTEPNPSTLVYHLREDVKFSDGSPMTATDVAWSLNHLLDPETGAATAGNVLSFDSATVSGPLQVTVKLEYADPLARENISVVSFIQKAEFGKAHPKDLGSPDAPPIGTGPYEVSNFDPQAVSLTRNQHYWGPDPAVDNVSFDFIATDDSAQLAMRSGSIQGASIGNLKNAEQWEAIEGATLNTMPAPTLTFLTLDTTTPPLDDIHVRKAIAYSIDRKGLLAAGYGEYADLLEGLASPSLLKSIAPSDEALTAALDGLPQYDLDLAKAKAELAKSRFPDGFTMTVPYVTDWPFAELTVLNLRENLEPLGVTINPKEVSLSQWAAEIYANGDETGMQPMMTTAPIPDPSAILGVIAGKENMERPGGNLANWSTPVVERASQQVNRDSDEAVRWQATKTLLSEIASDVPYIPLFSVDSVAVLADGFRFADEQTFFDLYANGTWIFALEAH